MLRATFVTRKRGKRNSAQWKLVDTGPGGIAVREGCGWLSGTLLFSATESEQGTHACVSPAGSTSY